MSQKDYTNEIIGQLLTSDKHVRGLAKAINTNQTTIARKLKELYKDNIVDYRQEGKNKVFFIRKNQEAKQRVYIYEHYKLSILIKRYPPLKNIINKLQKEKEANLILLFGSYAKQIAKKESDIDIYIESNDLKIKERIESYDTRISVKIGIYDKNSILIKEIEKDHAIIKGVEQFYEKTGFFE